MLETEYTKSYKSSSCSAVQWFADRSRMKPIAVNGAEVVVEREITSTKVGSKDKGFVAMHPSGAMVM